MQEAKYSFNIRFNLSGYDCQFTVRSEDEPGIDTLKKVPSILAELEKLGACGERRWEKVKNGNGNGHDKEEKASPNPKSDNDSTGSQEQRATAPVRGYYFPDAKGTTGVVGELPQEVCPHLLPQYVVITSLTPKVRQGLWASFLKRFAPTVGLLVK